MNLLLTILIVIAAILLCLIVFVQNSKGGGLSSEFSSSNQIMGVRKTTDVLEKTTWTLAASIVVLSVAISYFPPTKTGATSDAIMQEAVKDNATNPLNNPAAQFGQTTGDTPAADATDSTATK